MMLRSELTPLKDLVDNLTLIEPGSDTLSSIKGKNILEVVKVTGEQITAGWLKAVFSEVPDHSLQRYFYFHLEGISGLSDTLFNCLENNCPDYIERNLLQQVNEVLLALIGHMKKYFPVFFNGEANSPVLWRRQIQQKTVQQTSALIDNLRHSSLPYSQEASIISYLQEVMIAEKIAFFSFHALAYFENFVNDISQLYNAGKLNETELNNRLVTLDFNHLAYVEYRQAVLEGQLDAARQLSDKVKLLQREKRKLTSFLPNEEIKCHQGYPSLITMLSGRISEQLILMEEKPKLEPETCPEIHKNKIHLNISVAQMGCLLRVLYEENYFGSDSLCDIIKFVAQNFSSKKQEMISVGGLTKEYYSTNQVTAGKMIVQYQLLAARLKRIFFPLLVAASVIIGV